MVPAVSVVIPVVPVMAMMHRVAVAAAEQHEPDREPEEEEESFDVSFHGMIAPAGESGGENETGCGIPVFNAGCNRIHSRPIARLAKQHRSASTSLGTASISPLAKPRNRPTL